MESAKGTDLPELLERLGYSVRRVGRRYHTTSSSQSPLNSISACGKNCVRFLLQYNMVGTLGSRPGVSSISCQSYNKRSNWLTIAPLGYKVREQDCQPSSCCSVRFKQVEPCVRVTQ